jgi:hypothetical protein
VCEQGLSRLVTQTEQAFSSQIVGLMLEECENIVQYYEAGARVGKQIRLDMSVHAVSQKCFS